MAGTGAGKVTVAELIGAGVKRISMGSAIYFHAVAAVQQSMTALAA